MELFARAVAAVGGYEFVLVTVGQKGIGTLVHAEYDVAAVAAVTAHGAAVGDVLFAVEGDGAVSAVACLDINFYVVKEIHRSSESFFLSELGFVLMMGSSPR